MTNKPRQRAPAEDPPPEMFQRSPEQIAAERAQNDVLIAKMKAARQGGGDGAEIENEVVQTELHAELARIRDDAGAKPIAPMPSGEDTESAADTVAIKEAAALALERLRKNDQEKRALPCMGAMFPAGVPDGYHAQLAAEAAGRRRLRLMDGARACKDAGMASASRCEMFGSTDFCAHSLVVAMRERTIVNLTDGDVPLDERDKILAAVGWSIEQGAIAPVDLWKTDPLRIMRAFLAHEPATLGDFAENGNVTVAQVHPINGTTTEGIVALRGHERVLVYGGNNGRGKTIAGVYAIGRIGGYYTTHAKMLPRRSQTMDKLRTAPGIVVIDQAWRVERSQREAATLVLEDVVHDRAAARLDTLIIGNFNHATLFEYAERNVMERILGRGALLLFAGESLRGKVTP